MKPKFIHDCADQGCCEFLGHFHGHDVWYAAREMTMCVRYGDEGSEYSSYNVRAMPSLMHCPDWEMVVASEQSFRALLTGWTIIGIRAAPALSCCCDMKPDSITVAIIEDGGECEN